MHFNFLQIFNSTLILFSVIDILGSIPIMLDLRERVGNINSGKATIASAFIMLAFLFLGEQMLYLMGLDTSSFAIAGSIVIFFIALEMILGIRFYRDTAPETASIVPIAFPLIAGAGVFTTILSIRAEYHIENIVIAIIINIIFVYIILRNMPRIAKLLGKSGVNIIRKIFGVILLAIAIKLFKSNLGF